MKTSSKHFICFEGSLKSRVKIYQWKQIKQVKKYVTDKNKQMKTGQFIRTNEAIKQKKFVKQHTDKETLTI